MPQSLSPAPDMLAAIRAYLEGEILPGLKDAAWFNVKVAVNMLGIIERELRLGPELNAAETARLRSLLGGDGAPEVLNRGLAQAIRDGALAIDDPRLLAHLRQSTADALRINNPHWLEP